MSQRPPCAAARQAAFDKRRGWTTSQARLDFLRRSCPCDACHQQREPPRAQPMASNRGEVTISTATAATSIEVPR